MFRFTKAIPFACMDDAIMPLATAQADIYKGETAGAGDPVYTMFVAFSNQARKAGVDINAGQTLTKSMLRGGRGEIDFFSAVPSLVNLMKNKARMYENVDDAAGAAGALEQFLESSRALVDAALDAALPAETEPPTELHRAMRYAVFSGGKRLRPALAFGAAAAAGVDLRQAEPVAAAVELIHACSLVLDDLPSLDDDNVRRGRPSVHVTFGPATAILAGNALLANAFVQCTRLESPAAAVAAGAGLGRAIRSRGLIRGQIEDLAFTPAGASVADVTSIHLRKTAVLFRFAAWGGGVAAGLDGEPLERLGRYGRAYGLAFQIVDDLLDADLGECSILHVASEDEARQRVRNLLGEAARQVEAFGSRGWALGCCNGGDWARRWAQRSRFWLSPACRGRR